jgi:signal peptidase I
MRPVGELAAEVLRRGARLRIKARGGSMVPFLRDGDVVLVTPVADTDVAVGDVICYEAPPGGLCLHRVIERKRDRVLAKGDALAFTEVVDPADVLGKVVAVQRRGRVKRLDTRSARWRNRTLAATSILVPCLIPTAIRAWRDLRGVLRG